MMALIGGLINLMPCAAVLGMKRLYFVVEEKSRSHQATIFGFGRQAIRHLWRWRRYDPPSPCQIRWHGSPVPECMVYWFYGAGDVV